MAFTGQEYEVPIANDLLCTVDINVVAPLVVIDATSNSNMSILYDTANFTTDIQSVQDGLQSKADYISTKTNNSIHIPSDVCGSCAPVKEKLCGNCNGSHSQWKCPFKNQGFFCNTKEHKYFDNNC